MNLRTNAILDAENNLKNGIIAFFVVLTLFIFNQKQLNAITPDAMSSDPVVFFIHYQCDLFKKHFLFLFASTLLYVSFYAFIIAQSKSRNNPRNFSIIIRFLVGFLYYMGFFSFGLAYLKTSNIDKSYFFEREVVDIPAFHEISKQPYFTEDFTINFTKFDGTHSIKLIMGDILSNSQHVISNSNLTAIKNNICQNQSAKVLINNEYTFLMDVSYQEKFKYATLHRKITSLKINKRDCE